MTARPIRYQRQVLDRNGKIFYTSITSLSHISKHARQYAIYDKLKGKKRSESDDILYHSAGRYLTALKERGEAITPKKWRSELAALIPHKDTLYEKMRAMREDIKTVEQIRKAAEQLAKTEQTNTKKHEQER